MRVGTLCCAMLGVAMLVAQTPNLHQGGGNGADRIQRYDTSGSYLGVGVVDIDSQRARTLGLDEPKGAEVVHLEPNSPAVKAGVKVGDVLLTYNGENILGSAQLGRLVRETPPDRKVKIHLWREGRASDAMVLTEAPKQSNLLTAVPDVPSLMIPDFPSAMLMWKSGMLGIYCELVDSQLAEYFGVKQGVLVRFVLTGSIAQRAGLKAGDVLTKVGDRVVATPRDVTVALHLQPAGKPVPIVFTRDRKQMTLKVDFEETSPFYDKLPQTTNQ